MEFKEIVQFLGVAGSVASAVNPAIGGGMVLASKALQKFTEMQDETLTFSFIGLSALANDIREMVDSQNYDKDKLIQIADSLESSSIILQKFTKMVG